MLKFVETVDVDVSPNHTYTCSHTDRRGSISSSTNQIKTDCSSAQAYRKSADWTLLDQKLYESVSRNLPEKVLTLINQPAGEENSEWRVSPVKIDKFSGDTSLHLCCERGYTDILSILMNSPLANINAVDSKNRTPLHKALTGKQSAVSKCLIQNGANVDAPDQSQMTPLHIAAANGDTECVEIMVKNSANLEVETKEGLTALAIAASRNQMDVADVLMNNNANKNATDHMKRTPLMLAAINGHKEMVDFLIVRDADPNKLDINGKNFIQLANEAGKSNAVAVHIGKHLNSGHPPVAGSMRRSSSINSPIPGVLRKHPHGVSNHHPVNPPRRRSSKLEALPIHELVSLPEAMNSQLSINSTSSGSSSHSANRMSVGGQDIHLSSPFSDNLSLNGMPERNVSYIKQLEKQNASLMKQHYEMQEAIAVLKNEQKKEAQIPTETAKKITVLEETVKNLMIALESNQKTPTNITTSSSAATANHVKHSNTSFGSNGSSDEQSSSGYELSSASSNQQSPLRDPNSNSLGLLTMSSQPSTTANGTTSTTDSNTAAAFSNYYNMSALAERQRHSQSSDSGYGGVSPTGSGVRTTPTRTNSGLTSTEIRGELAIAMQSLKELTTQQSKMQQALESQANAIKSVTKTIAALENSLQQNEINPPMPPSHAPPPPPLPSTQLPNANASKNTKNTNRVSALENHVL